MEVQWEPRMPKGVNEADGLLWNTDTLEARTGAGEPTTFNAANEADALP